LKLLLWELQTHLCWTSSSIILIIWEWIIQADMETSMGEIQWPNEAVLKYKLIDI
jgi:hypothetical protein